VTIADILAVTGIDFARMVRFRPDAELVNVGRWLKAMMARPAAKAGCRQKILPLWGRWPRGPEGVLSGPCH
jgi:glutathione S-transferase